MHSKTNRQLLKLEGDETSVFSRCTAWKNKTRLQSVAVSIYHLIPRICAGQDSQFCWRAAWAVNIHSLFSIRSHIYSRLRSKMKRLIQVRDGAVAGIINALFFPSYIEQSSPRFEPMTRPSHSSQAELSRLDH